MRKNVTTAITMPSIMIRIKMAAMRYKDTNPFSFDAMICFFRPACQIRRIGALFLVGILGLIVPLNLFGDDDLVSRADDLFLNNRLDEAAALFETAVAQNPANEDLYLRLGYIYEQKRNYDQAVQLLVDLRDLGAKEARLSQANARIRDVRERHSNKPSLIRRLEKTGYCQLTPQ